MVFASFPVSCTLGFKQVQLGFSPMGRGDLQGQKEHYFYVEYILEVHGKTFDNVVEIIGDKNSTIKAFAQ